MVEKNSALLAKKGRIESIKLIKDETERSKKIKELLIQEGIDVVNSVEEIAASSLQGQSIYKPVITPKTIEELGASFRKLAKLTDEEAAPILKKITDLTQGFLTGDDDDDPTPLDRKIKAFTKKTFDLLSEIRGFEQDLLNTTYRTQQQIIKDEQKLQEDSITLKRDEFKAKQQIRLDNFIAQQEANKELKGADVEAIDEAIARAKEMTSTSKNRSRYRGYNAIAAIKKVTKARISNQQELEDFEKKNAEAAITESGDATNLAMMPEGMAKVEAEAALDQLRYDNKVLAAERELELLTTTDERRREIENQMALWQDEKRATDLENEINVINEKQRVQEEYLGFMSGLSSILAGISNKNKEWQKASLILEKSIAISKVITEANASIGEQTSSYAASKVSATRLAFKAAAAAPGPFFCCCCF